MSVKRNAEGSHVSSSLLRGDHERFPMPFAAESPRHGEPVRSHQIARAARILPVSCCHLRPRAGRRSKGYRRSRLPNLRSVSISPWCDEDHMGAALRGGKVIYSRKPMPSLVSGAHLHEEAFTEHVRKTLMGGQGLPSPVRLPRRLYPGGRKGAREADRRHHSTVDRQGMVSRQDQRQVLLTRVS